LMYSAIIHQLILQRNTHTVAKGLVLAGFLISCRKREFEGWQYPLGIFHTSITNRKIEDYNERINGKGWNSGRRD